jgi:hypothetical protein
LFRQTTTTTKEFWRERKLFFPSQAISSNLCPIKTASLKFREKSWPGLIAYVKGREKTDAFSLSPKKTHLPLFQVC